MKDKDIAIRSNTCKAFNPLQTQMVDELREKAYGADITQSQFFQVNIQTRVGYLILAVHLLQDNNILSDPFDHLRSLTFRNVHMNLCC